VRAYEILALPSISYSGVVMKRVLSFVVSIVLMAGCAFASTEGDRAKLQDRLDDAATIMNEIMSAPDKGIPEEVLNNAQCVAVVPSMFKASLGFGGQYGQGVVTCRTQAGWSAPAFYRLSGGSFGLQIGGQAVDLVMLFMNDLGMHSLLTHKLKLGVDASAAAGPVGRHVAADTDVVFRSEVLTYSRTRGLFAGISLNGSWVEQNDRDTRDFYGRYLLFQTILKGNVQTPPAAQNFISTVTRYTMQPGATQAVKPGPTVPTTSTQSQRPGQSSTSTSTVSSQSSNPQQSVTPQGAVPAPTRAAPVPQTQVPAPNQAQTQPEGASPVPKRN
jgi:SH3 domain-containing YSC84-like protein 1